jgi:integrase
VLVPKYAEVPADIKAALSRVGSELALRGLKTESSAASVPVPAELVTMLRQLRREQLANPVVARANIESLCRRADARVIRLHDLRHSCATLSFAEGADAATLQRIPRHSSISVTTGTYVEVIERFQRCRQRRRQSEPEALPQDGGNGR